MKVALEGGEKERKRENFVCVGGGVGWGGGGRGEASRVDTDSKMYL